MPNIAQNKLIIQQSDWHANFTETNHLGAAFLAEPHRFDKVLTRVFTASEIADNPLIAATKGSGRESTIGSFEWEWDLMGASTRPCIATENLDPTNQTPGLLRSEFKIKLAEDWFVPGDIITPHNKDYQCRVQRAPVGSGNGFTYTLRLMTDESTDFLPPSYLAPHVQWNKLYSVYEEGSDQAGSTTYATPFKLASQLSTLKKQYSVTGDAANQALVVGLMDANGKIHKKEGKWVKYAEAEYWIQWHKEIERILWYGKKTNTVPGANGRFARTGPGIQELLADSHVYRYNTLTEKLLQEYLMDIFFGRVGMGKREIVAYTGEYGMLAFDQAMKNAAKPFLVEDTKFVEGSGRNLTFGGQFVRYRGPNGIGLTLKHNPMYDNQEINGEMHPELQKPLESFRFTFLDFGNNGANGNIKFVKKEGGYKMGYKSGLQTPYGPNKGGMMSDTKDAYTMVVMDQCGVQIDDVSRCGELILDLN